MNTGVRQAQKDVERSSNGCGKCNDSTTKERAQMGKYVAVYSPALNSLSGRSRDNGKKPQDRLPTGVDKNGA